MKTSETINDLAAALAKAQGAIQNPPKNRTVTVRSDKGNYTFDYATLDAILDVLKKPLSDNGLAFLQAIDSHDGKMILTTRLMHASGQWIETETPVAVTGNGMQAIGSAQTYARRYAISSLLGVAADEDDDANTADGNGIENKADRKPGAKTAAPTPQPTVEKWRQDAETVKLAIDKAETVQAVNEILSVEKDVIAELAKRSPSAAEFLTDRAKKRMAALASAPAKAA